MDLKVYSSKINVFPLLPVGFSFHFSYFEALQRRSRATDLKKEEDEFVATSEQKNEDIISGETWLKRLFALEAEHCK